MAKKRNNSSELYNNYTKKDLTNIYKKILNEKELKNIVKDDVEKTRTGDVKNPRAEANKFEKYLPTKETIDFFQNIKKENTPAEFREALKIQQERGNPAINVGTNKGLPFHNKRNYNPFTNEINIPKSSEYKSDMDNYITEVGHAGQPLSDVIPRFLKNDVPGYIKAYISKGNNNDNIHKYVYDNPNTVENYTHSKIQPELENRIYSSYSWPKSKEEEGDFIEYTRQNINSFNNNKKADGGQLNNELDSKYNNYLNNDMRQYAQGGDLTRFDAGGTHEQNPNGGVPQGMAPDGSQNVVEQGESKKGNFIYSNRIELNKDLIKQFSLPGYVAGKSVSDASKAIDDKFKDRSDKYAQETKKTLLDRLANAQEYLKQQEQASIDKTNESMQANSQEIPDQMNGQIPEGMEEYVEETSVNPQEVQAEQIMQAQPESPIAAFGGYQVKRFDFGGNFASMNALDPNAGVGYSFKPPAMTSNSVLTKPSVLGNGVGTTGTGTPSATSVAPAMPSAGAMVGAASGAFDLAKTAFGKPAQDTSGQAESAKVDKVGMIGSSALKGAAAGAALGPIGAGVGAAVGLAAGIIGAKKAKQAALENTNNFAINTNNKVSDNYAAYGGMLGITRMAKGGNIYANGGAVNEGPGKRIRNADGSYSMVTTTTNQVSPGIAGSRIPGTPGSPAVLPTRGVNSTDVERNRAFAAARNAGQSTFMYKGKPYTTEMSGTPGKPAIAPTPDIITPSIPPRYETITQTTPMPSQIYNVNATRGTIGGTVRPGVGGSITPQSQITQNQEMANRTISANEAYNKNLQNKYAPDTENLRGLNPQQLARKNAISSQRLKDLKGNAFATEIPVQLGLERPTVNELRQKSGYAMGGNMNMYVGGGRAKIISTNELKPVGLTDLKNAANINNLKFNTSNIKVTSKAPDLTLYDRAKIGLKDTGKYLSENVGDIARLAPIAMNAYQLKNLKKPEGFQYETLANRYKPQYVDEAQMQRIVDQEGNNTMAAIGQMGGSEGATRNAILAMGLNKTKALGDAYANAAAQNRAQDAQAQQFNLGVDTQNMMIRNKAMDEMRADEGAYDTARSKYLSSIGTDIGDIGKEKNASDAAITMFGYTRKGKYVVDKNGNKVSPEVLAKRQADFATYMSEQNKKAKG